MDDSTDKYAIKIIENNKEDIKQPKAVKNKILPKCPCSYLIVGRSGSGKTNVLVNLLTNPNLLGGYYHYIVLFSPVKTDDVIKNGLDLPKSNIINDFDEPDVEKILTKLETMIEKKGMTHTANKHRVALIFDDILSKKKFLNGNLMKKLATAGRHYAISTFILTQYYRLIPPVIRMNVSGIIFFPASELESEKLAEEYTPASCTKKQMMNMIKHATDKPYQFLFINTRADIGQQIRKGFNVTLSCTNLSN